MFPPGFDPGTLSVNKADALPTELRKPSIFSWADRNSFALEPQQNLIFTLIEANRSFGRILPRDVLDDPPNCSNWSLELIGDFEISIEV